MLVSRVCALKCTAAKHPKTALIICGECFLNKLELCYDTMSLAFTKKCIGLFEDIIFSPFQSEEKCLSMSRDERLTRTAVLKGPGMGIP